MPMTLVRLSNVHLNEAYSKVRICRYPSYEFPVQYGLKQGDALWPLPFCFALENAIRKANKYVCVWKVCIWSVLTMLI